MAHWGALIWEVWQSIFLPSNAELLEMLPTTAECWYDNYMYYCDELFLSEHEYELKFYIYGLV